MQQKTSLSLVSSVPRNVAIWGRVVFATQETSPYDIAVVSLEEELNGVPVPVPAEHFHEGKGRALEGWGARLDPRQELVLTLIMPDPIPSRQA